MPCVTVCLLFLIQSATLTYHPQKAISIEEPLFEPLEWEWHVWCSSKRAASGWALLKCDFFGKKVNIWRPKLPPKSPRKILLWEHIFVDASHGCFFDNGERRLDSLRDSIFGFSGWVFGICMDQPVRKPWDFVLNTPQWCIPSVYPPPRMPVTNEGLGWDSLLKME